MSRFALSRSKISAAENNAGRRIVVLAANLVVKHSAIHVNLPDILVRDLAHLEIDEKEALEDVIVVLRTDR